MLCTSAVLNNSSTEEAMFAVSIVKIKTINKDVLDSGTDKLCTQVGLHQSTDKNVCIVYDQS